MEIFKQGNVTIRTATAEDVDALKDHLRKEDEQEVIAAGFESSETALAYSFEKSSEAFTIERDGVPCGMFGIVPESILGPTANVWFLGSEGMGDIKKTFVKMSIPMVGDFLKRYPTLWGLVDSRYDSTVKWLRLIGAKFDHEVKLGGHNFRVFSFRRA